MLCLLFFAEHSRSKRGVGVTMTLQIELNNKAAERLVDLYCKTENLRGRDTSTMQKDIEHYAERLLTESIRAKYNFYAER